MAAGFLRVKGTSIVDQHGNQVLSRGVAPGGMLNIQNSITGFPGTETAVRTAMLLAMGRNKYEYFFHRFMQHFFTERDADLLQSIGLNCVRVPFSYKHLEDDMNPRVLKEKGFMHLDRVVEICSSRGIHTILDLHTVPGCQNGDWHSDNHTSYAAFWDFKDHQDRTVWLWEHIARRYKNNIWVAGYNPLNEPCDPLQVRVAAFYDRLEQAIRAIDPSHILFFDGNTFAMEWKGFHRILPNSVYSIHDYSMMGFSTGSRYRGEPEQKSKLRAQFARKCEFHHQHGVPIWVGEFGPTYEREGPETSDINAERYNLLAEQLEIYEKAEISWSIWTYKDIGVMGVVSTSPESAWMKLLQPFLEKKAGLQVDSFTTRPSKEVDVLLANFAD